MLGFLSVLSIFALVTLSSYSVVPQPELAETRQPSMVGVFESVVGDWGEVFISVAVIVSVLGAYLAWTLMAAEVMFIPARAGRLPASSWGRRTPAAPRSPPSWSPRSACRGCSR